MGRGASGDVRSPREKPGADAVLPRPAVASPAAWQGLRWRIGSGELGRARQSSAEAGGALSRFSPPGVGNSIAARPALRARGTTVRFTRHQRSAGPGGGHRVQGLSAPGVLGHGGDRDTAPPTRHAEWKDHPCRQDTTRPSRAASSAMAPQPPPPDRLLVGHAADVDLSSSVSAPFVQIDQSDLQLVMSFPCTARQVASIVGREMQFFKSADTATARRVAVAKKWESCILRDGEWDEARMGVFVLGGERARERERARHRERAEHKGRGREPTCPLAHLPRPTSTPPPKRGRRPALTSQPCRHLLLPLADLSCRPSSPPGPRSSSPSHILEFRRAHRRARAQGGHVATPREKKKKRGGGSVPKASALAGKSWAPTAYPVRGWARSEVDAVTEWPPAREKGWFQHADPEATRFRSPPPFGRSTPAPHLEGNASYSRLQLDAIEGIRVRETVGHRPDPPASRRHGGQMFSLCMSRSQGHACARRRCFHVHRPNPSARPHTDVAKSPWATTREPDLWGNMSVEVPPGEG
ncbi:unnamed protein product [Diplocarpon coronariae]